MSHDFHPYLYYVARSILLAYQPASCCQKSRERGSHRTSKGNRRVVVTIALLASPIAALSLDEYLGTGILRYPPFMLLEPSQRRGTCSQLHRFPALSLPCTSNPQRRLRRRCAEWFESGAGACERNKAQRHCPAALAGKHGTKELSTQGHCPPPLYSCSPTRQSVNNRYGAMLYDSTSLLV